jgi:hypothetical protein
VDKVTSILLVLSAFIACTLAAVEPTSSQTDGEPETGPRIEWDHKTRVRIQSGTYGRAIRLRNHQILFSYEAQGKSWVCRSRDNGKTWSEPILVRALTEANAANPELLQLKSGRILLFYNQRPHNESKPFAIGYSYSDDNGRTWASLEKFIYKAGNKPQNGCWEPAAIQLDTGEIQLFFANESPYMTNDDQEITLMRSFDEGKSWSAPETVSYRAGHRDGMPVPIILNGGKGIALAIEDNGLAPGNMLQPAIVFSSKQSNWRQPTAKGDSPNRWNALKPPLPGNVYAGAPYLRQFPSGETVLSCQSSEGGRKQPKMVVYVGDSSARNFRNKSVPFDIPNDEGGMWNSLFIKDARTVTAISDTVVNGVRGLWAIDGHLVNTGNP